MDRRKERKNKLTMKQWICLALVGVMLLGVLPIAAFAADDGIATIADVTKSTSVWPGRSSFVNVDNYRSGKVSDVEVKDSNGNIVEGITVTETNMGVTVTADSDVAAGDYVVTFKYTRNNNTKFVELKVTVQGWGNSGNTGTSTNAGTMGHLEVEIHATAGVVIEGKTHNVDIVLTEADVTASTTEIVAVYDGQRYEVPFGSTGVQVNGVDTYWRSTDTDYSTEDDTVRMNGRFPTGTKSKPVYYTITISKDVTTTIDGVRYTIPVTMTVTSNYWTEDNHCPGLGGNWSNGGFSSNSGIDVHLGATGKVSTIKLIKYVDGLTGNAASDMTFEFEAYTKNEDGSFTKKIDVPAMTLEKGDSFTGVQLNAFVSGVTPATYYIIEKNAPAVSGMAYEGVTYTAGEDITITSENITIGGVSYNAAVVTVAKGATAEVVARNNYKPATGSLEIIKVVEGIKFTEDTTYNFTVNDRTVSVTVPAGETTAYKIVENLVPGKYTVTEQTPAAIEDYEWSVDQKNVEVEVVAGKTEKVTFVNTYTYVQPKGALILKKVVSDVAVSKDNAPIFRFAVTDAAGKTEYYEIAAGGEEKLTLNAGNYTITEVEPEKVEITNYKFVSSSYKVGDNDAKAGETVVVCTNTYERKTAEVTISKMVTGNMGDQTKYFTFAVYVDGEQFGEEFTLKHGETKKIAGVPVGATFKVEEQNPAPYKVKINDQEDADAIIEFTVEDAGRTVAYENNYNVKIDTGVSLDVIPFVILLAIAGGALVLLNRKRLF